MSFLLGTELPTGSVINQNTRVIIGLFSLSLPTYDYATNLQCCSLEARCYLINKQGSIVYSLLKLLFDTAKSRTGNTTAFKKTRPEKLMPPSLLLS
jgi:hypothetical protein